MEHTHIYIYVYSDRYMHIFSYIGLLDMAVILQLVSICHEYIHLNYESRVYMYRYIVCMYVSVHA